MIAECTIWSRLGERSLNLLAGPGDGKDADLRIRISASGLLSLARQDASDLVYKCILTSDDAVPNPNSIFLQSLQILSALETTEELRLHAGKNDRGHYPPGSGESFAHASFLNAMDSWLGGFEIVIAGNDANSLAAIARSNRSGRSVIDRQE